MPEGRQPRRRLGALTPELFLSRMVPELVSAPSLRLADSPPETEVNQHADARF